MNDIRNLDTISECESTAPTDLPASETPRRPWHKPMLRRSDVSLSTRGGLGQVMDGNSSS